MPQLRAQGLGLYYEIHGQHAGTPLLLCVGLGGSCRGWLPLQVPEFSAQRRTLIFDYPGVGESRGGEASFSTADLADTVVALLDALEIERVDALGSFMGGMVAQELALRHPERLDRLILVGTYARADAKRVTLLRQWQALARIGASVEIFVRERMLWTLQDETLEQQDLIDSMVGLYTDEGIPLSAEVFARQCEACIEHDTLDRLAQIRQRTLVVCGRNDQLTPPKFHRQLADEIPDAHLVTLSYGGHMVMAESAEPFNHTVLQFLADGR